MHRRVGGSGDVVTWDTTTDRLEEREHDKRRNRGGRRGRRGDEPEGDDYQQPADDVARSEHRQDRADRHVGRKEDEREHMEHGEEGSDDRQAGDGDRADHGPDSHRVPRRSQTVALAGRTATVAVATISWLTPARSTSYLSRSLNAS